MSRNLTDGAFRRVFTEALDERMDFVGAGREREDAMDDETDPERCLELRDGVRSSSIGDALIETLDGLDRTPPRMLDQNEESDLSSVFRC